MSETYTSEELLKLCHLCIHGQRPGRKESRAMAKALQALLKAGELKALAGTEFFAMYPTGVTAFDEDKLREAAAGDPNGAMQPFYATAILNLMGKMQRGELKGATPHDLFIGIVKGKQ